MNMQQMMIQAQKMQRELKKAQDELGKKEFTVTKNGAVTITMLGTKEITKVDIDEAALEKDNKEMIEELIMIAVNELLNKISQEEEAINARITGRVGGFGF